MGCAIAAEYSAILQAIPLAPPEGSLERPSAREAAAVEMTGPAEPTDIRAGWLDKASRFWHRQSASNGDSSRTLSARRLLPPGRRANSFKEGPMRQVFRV